MKATVVCRCSRVINPISKTNQGYTQKPSETHQLLDETTEQSKHRSTTKTNANIDKNRLCDNCCHIFALVQDIL